MPMRLAQVHDRTHVRTVSRIRADPTHEFDQVMGAKLTPNLHAHQRFIGVDEVLRIHDDPRITRGDPLAAMTCLRLS